MGPKPRSAKEVEELRPFIERLHPEHAQRRLLAAYDSRGLEIKALRQELLRHTLTGVVTVGLGLIDANREHDLREGGT